MAASRRQQILEALRTRCRAIKKADGFATDAGKVVFLGEAPALGPDDPESAVALVVGDDVVSYQGNDVKLSIHLPVNVVALVKADLEAPWEMVEAVLQDIKTAVELEDRQFGDLLANTMRRGSTRSLDREPGSMTVGVAVQYDLPYAEPWGGA